MCQPTVFTESVFVRSSQAADVVVHGSVWDEANAEAVRESQSPGRDAMEVFLGPNMGFHSKILTYHVVLNIWYCVKRGFI